MRIALIDTTKRRSHYSVALLKLGAWIRDRGDECALFEGTLPPAGEFDEAWLSTVFSFDMPRALDFARASRDRVERVQLGGVSASLFPDYFTREGFEVVRGIVPEADGFPPAYDLLSERPEYAITKTTHGCPRSCDFCMVPRIEPKFGAREHWQDAVPEGVSQIIFYDNNILALPPRKLDCTLTEICDLAAERKIREIDINPGLDARLLTSRSADLLEGLPGLSPRFAFDGMQADGYYQRAVRMMAERGTKEFRTYVLFNHTGTLAEFYYRIRTSAELQVELRAAGYRVTVKSYPMKFTPVVEPDLARDHIGFHWRRSDRDAVRKILSSSSGGSMCVSPTTLDEFEYWWGRNVDEFLTLLRYPKLSLLLQRRRGSLRLKRARATQRNRSDGR